MLCMPLPGTGKYKLMSTMRFGPHEIAEGLEWDGASIPRVLWTVLGLTPFHPSVMRASAGHDKGYTDKVGRRRDWDRWFKETLIEDGMDPNTAQVLYLGVRSGGSWTWYDEEDIAALEEDDQDFIEDGP